MYQIKHVQIFIQLETSKHDSRSSFIAPSNRKVSMRSNQMNLLYYFIIEIHTEDCTHIYTNQYKLIICYIISWLNDLSFTKIVCIVIFFSFLIKKKDTRVEFESLVAFLKKLRRLLIYSFHFKCFNFHIGKDVASGFPKFNLFLLNFIIYAFFVIVS